ncbi:ExsB protein (plasmid) [Legionella adelaidensis]|uniref:7-cyano-7-deazaguanine synthase n=1 Tax=Legionella adelaidensis TaxID=45056 RepID=A0A0W0R1I2_9GAMM|nr:7-cyano-7-deazaguanine synthase QueC [Legionella adelaidensis]KTC64843.1 ExsB protein [Legionella adelaidensis]VEH82986.1 ExsB protein [Legionella adelaidensis]
MKKAVILLSGGLDSATCLAIAKQQGFACYALSFAYGQRHDFELEAAKKLAQSMHAVDHRIISLDIGQFGASALTDSSIVVEDYKGDNKIPVTYVPARNTVFLSIALSLAESINAFDIFIGANFIDYSGYPDCRPEYIEAFEKLANLATKAGVEGNQYTIHAPLLYLSKAEIIKTGTHLHVPYELTVSCYRLDKNGAACGKCDSCIFRARGFNEANIADPTHYF